MPLKRYDSITYYEDVLELLRWAKRFHERVSSDGIHGGTRARVRPGSREPYGGLIGPCGDVFAIDFEVEQDPPWKTLNYQIFNRAFQRALEKHMPTLLAEVVKELDAARKHAAQHARDDALDLLKAAQEEIDT